MAMVLNTGASEVNRENLFILDPMEIEVAEGMRGRKFPPTEAEIIELANSILANGQLEPVQCRRIEDNRVQLTLGFTRMAAIRLIVAGFTSDGEFKHDPKYKIRCIVFRDMNAETAFVNNIVENQHRNPTSAVDDAWNHENMRSRYGYDDKKIATIYGCSVRAVQRIRPLLGLSTAHQLLVHKGPANGGMSVEAALELVALAEDDRDAIVNNILADGSAATAPAVRAVLRTRQHAEFQSPNAATEGDAAAGATSDESEGDTTGQTTMLDDDLEAAAMRHALRPGGRTANNGTDTGQVAGRVLNDDGHDHSGKQAVQKQKSLQLTPKEFRQVLEALADDADAKICAVGRTLLQVWRGEVPAEEARQALVLFREKRERRVPPPAVSEAAVTA